MTGDSRIQHDSRVNGPANAPPSSDPRTLSEICTELRQKVTAFLERPTEDELIQRVQGQVRTSIKVIEEALRRYRYVRQHKRGRPSTMLTRQQPRRALSFIQWRERLPGLAGLDLGLSAKTGFIQYCSHPTTVPPGCLYRIFPPIP